MYSRLARLTEIKLTGDGQGMRVNKVPKSWIYLAQMLGACCAAAVLPLFPSTVYADEGGVGFYLPGQMGSLSAVPGDAGWSLPLIYFHQAGNAGGNREFEIGGQVRLNLGAKADLLMAVPTYTFSAPVLGGQAALSATALAGHVAVDVTATLTGPFGGVLTGAQSDARDGIGDLFPTGTLKWNRGAHNFMSYLMAGVPVGTYDASRLANVGANHWALDGGGGYTYLDLGKGHEFTAVLGLTYNFENPDTHYRNGVDSHLDWAASQFLSEHLHVGLVGYVYEQLTGDTGSGDLLGDFKGRAWAIGPQVGYFAPVGNQKWYVSLKGFEEFSVEHRTEGWNLWLAVVIPLSAGK